MMSTVNPSRFPIHLPRALAGPTAALLIAGCASWSGPRDAPRPSALAMQQAALDFADAAAQGDALAMARAAAARAPYDRLLPPGMGEDSAAMFRQARARAGQDATLLARIEALQTQGLPGNLHRLGGPAGESPPMADRLLPLQVLGAAMLENPRAEDPGTAPTAATCAADDLPVATTPARSLSLAPGARQQFCARIAASVTLMVYAAGPREAVLSLSVHDLDRAEPVCLARRHNPICIWTSPRRTTGVFITIENPGADVVRVTLIAHRA